jgi:hypothetical protein
MKTTMSTVGRRSEWVYAKGVAEVFRHTPMMVSEGLDGTDVFVLAAIAGYLNPKKGRFTAFPSLEALATACGRDEKTVRRCIKSLKETGYLTVSDELPRVNTYRINLPGLDGSPFPDEDVIPNFSTPASPEVNAELAQLLFEQIGSPTDKAEALGSWIPILASMMPVRNREELERMIRFIPVRAYWLNRISQAPNPALEFKSGAVDLAGQSARPFSSSKPPTSTKSVNSRYATED